MKTKLTIALLTLSAAFLLLWKPSHDHEEEKEDPEEKVIVLNEEQIEKAGLEFKPAHAKTLEINMKKVGRLAVHPDNIVHVVPSVQGQIGSAEKNVGDVVKAGDILAKISSKEISEYKTAFLNALRNQESQNIIFEREKNLYEKGIASQAEFKQAETDYMSATFQLELAKQNLFLNGLTLEDIAHIDGDTDLRSMAIRSPIDGIVIGRHASQGEISNSSSPIFIIANLSTLRFEIPLFPSEFSAVKKGLSVRIDGMPDGQITGIIPPLSEDSPIAVAIVDLENKAEAGAGQVRNVSILLENLPVKLAVEKEAIQTLDNKPHLFIKNDKGLVKREVSLGSRDDSFVEITAGLEENEIYTSKNSFILKADLGKEDVEDDD